MVQLLLYPSEPVDPTGVDTTPKTTSVAVGATRKITATVAPAEANQTVTWSSSDETKVTVDASGTVKGVGAGTCTVTAKTVNNSTANVAVTVTEQN